MRVQKKVKKKTQWAMGHVHSSLWSEFVDDSGGGNLTRWTNINQFLKNTCRAVYGWGRVFNISGIFDTEQIPGLQTAENTVDLLYIKYW